MTTIDDEVHEFFDRYAAALLARDEAAVARLYAVPALIVFPGTTIPVTDARQTEQFFASAWEQYAGVDSADARITLLAHGPAGVWADVTWSSDGEPRERFCYQLLRGRDGWQIVVLTPLELIG
ncbi:hypothetical protein [Cellulomonas cellasea]|uniref:Ketosteroid isomerase-like protein n=1 Tax=Cellulomonas cellasea TaxID=43670 RepID=A0A7W4Y9Y3_9CELL|nr:hypothetical protein [Cellulomonas cellasea]MBB2922058.1 ketosteroid isomerase-like protein [Cellulomonas cellasea]